MIKRILLGVGLVALILTPAVYAAVVSGESTGILASETLDDDLFIAGEDVLIDGTVNGDVYAAGSNITVNGTINGDLIAAGETITITGTITEDARLAGQTIIAHNAKIGDSVSVLAGKATFNEGSIGGGLLFAASNLTLRSSVERGVTGMGDTVVIDSSVGKDVNVAVSNLRLQSGAQVAGNLTYHSEAIASIPDEAMVSGEVTRKGPFSPATPTTDSLGYKLWQFMAALLVGALLLRFAPRVMNGAKAQIATRPGKSMLAGLLVLLLSVPFFVLLMVTIVGIPLGLILVVMFGVALYLAKLFVAYTAAEWSFKKLNTESKNPYLMLSVGLAFYFALSMLALIGGWVVFLTLIAGLGGLFMYLNPARSKAKAPAKKTKNS